jgi:hypothetical protein
MQAGLPVIHSQHKVIIIELIDSASKQTDLLYTVKKGYRFSLPNRDSLIKLFLAGIIKFFPARESLVSDIPIPTGDGKITNLF